MQAMPNLNLYQICECCCRIATSMKSRQKTLLCPYHREDATACKRMLKLRKVLDDTGSKARELDDVILNRAMKKSRALRESGFKAFLLRSLPLEFERMLRKSPFPAELCDRIRQEPPDLRTTALFPLFFSVFPRLSKNLTVISALLNPFYGRLKNHPMFRHAKTHVSRNCVKKCTSLAHVILLPTGICFAMRKPGWRQRSNIHG